MAVVTTTVAITTAAVITTAVAATTTVATAAGAAVTVVAATAVGTAVTATEIAAQSRHDVATLRARAPCHPQARRHHDDGLVALCLQHRRLLRARGQGPERAGDEPPRRERGVARSLDRCPDPQAPGAGPASTPVRHRSPGSAG